MAEVKYVLSDLGGVILETDFNRFAKAVKKASSKNDIDLDYRLKVFCDMDFYRLFALGKIEPLDFYDYASSYLKLDVEYGVFVKLWNKVIVKPNKKYCAFLRKAKAAGYTLILLSNIDILHWGHICKTCHKIIKLFDRIFLSCDHGLAKPDILFFKYLRHCLEIKEQKTIFIDDRKENLLAAKRYKINTLLYDRFRHKEFIKEAGVFLPDIKF